MSFWNALASAYGTYQQNKNIDKQLAAQKQEQQQNREYNLELAKQQNSWNIQQWNRENAYNSPAAQMERMRQAGLNPDMMYGGGVSGNLAASSPQMTSGAPSSSMDWASLANKQTVADAVIRNAQLEQIDAMTNKIKSETKGQDIQNNIQAFESEIIELMREEGYQGTIATARATYEEYEAKLKKTNFKSENDKYNYLVDELEHNKAVREFERSLHEDKKKIFKEMYREALATANIKTFYDEMKEADFWTDKGIQAAQAIGGIVGAAGKFSNPVKILEHYHDYR